MNKKIKVLIKTYGLTSGGVETIIVNLQQCMSEDICFDYLTDRRGPEFYDEVIEQCNSKRFSLDTDYIRNKFLRTAIFIQRMNAFFRENRKYDIVHINESAFQALLISIIASINGYQNIIVHAHTNLKDDKFSASKIFSWMIKKLFPLFSKNYIACSEYAAKSMFAKKYLGTSVLILKNGIDSKKYLFNRDIREKFRKKYHLDGKYVIGNVGRLAKQKNQKFLLDLMPEVRKFAVNALLILVGMGRDEEMLRRRVKDLGIEEYVLFWGETNQIHLLLQAFDVFVFPSVSEGFGIAALEAQAAGLRVIASTGVPKEIEITNLIQWADLNHPDKWLDYLKEDMKGYSRENTQSMIIDSGYDIRESANKLENYYRLLVTRSKEQLDLP